MEQGLSSGLAQQGISSTNRQQRLRLQLPKNVGFSQRPSSSDACNIITQYLLNYAVVNFLIYILTLI